MRHPNPADDGVSSGGRYDHGISVGPPSSRLELAALGSERAVLPLDSIEARFHRIVRGERWVDVEERMRAAERVFIIGNGGNLAVAQHAATDLVRLTEKAAHAPGDAVSTTALANDGGFEGWLAQWVHNALRGSASDGTLLIGLSCSGVSPAVMRALQEAQQTGVDTVLISAVEPVAEAASAVIVLDTEYFHSAEILMTLLMYQLALAAGGAARPTT